MFDISQFQHDMVASVLVHLGDSSVGKIGPRGSVLPFVYGIHQVHEAWFPDCGDRNHIFCQIVCYGLCYLSMTTGACRIWCKAFEA